MNSQLFITLRLGLKTLSLHKLRSFLAALGILIGVAAVVWLVAVAEGVTVGALKSIEEMGAKNIIIRSIKPATNSSQQQGLYLTYGLFRSDFDRISKTIPMVRRATPLRELHFEIRRNDKSLQSRVVGCTPAYREMNKLELAMGRFLEDRDASASDNVCVLAFGAAAELFPYENPINRTVQIQNDFYVVVGVTKHREASGAIGGSMSGQDYSKDVYIPLETLRQRIGDQVMVSRAAGSREFEIVQLSQITVTVGDMKEVEPARENIETLLEQVKEHSTSKDYSIIVPKELLAQAEFVRNGLLILSVVIAAGSLLVGGIGIMNIMLATVTERTREIGIRRALGAKRSDIIRQFLIETLLLTTIGGVLGVLLGLAVKPVWMLTKPFIPHELYLRFPPDYRALAEAFQPEYVFLSFVVAFAIALIVGVLAGVYPAFRAARMDPIEALRHE